MARVIVAFDRAHKPVKVATRVNEMGLLVAHNKDSTSVQQLERARSSRTMIKFRDMQQLDVRVPSCKDHVDIQGVVFCNT